MEQAHQKMLYKPHKLNMTCFKLIIAIAVIHGAEPNVYKMLTKCLQNVYQMFNKNISISAMKVLLISAFASTAENPCLLSSSPPSSLFVPTGPFCVHGICITSRIKIFLLTLTLMNLRQSPNARMKQT